MIPSRIKVTVTAKGIKIRGIPPLFRPSPAVPIYMLVFFDTIIPQRSPAPIFAKIEPPGQKSDGSHEPIYLWNCFTFIPIQENRTEGRFVYIPIA